MGDYAKGIANITIRLSEKEHIDLPKGDIKEMAELGLGMLHRALEAFTQLDVETARIIPAEDDRVDELYNRIYHKLVKRVIADPENVDSASHIMWAAHDLERLADRVTNICERIVFVVTGEMTEMDHNDDEVKGK
jgi:phosphate transport system protein